jgi:hypothetical protein
MAENTKNVCNIIYYTSSISQLTHLKKTAIEIQGIKIIKKNETRRKEHSI